jgi:tetraacyldisaccharide 4'-kinase
MSQARLEALWLIESQQRGWLAWLLWPASIVYGLLMAARRLLYGLGLKKTHKLDVPVVVVGNVVVGGAGKTPTVIAVVNHLRARGWHPGVVSRGHGRQSQQMVDVQPDTPLSDSGDEPALIRLRTGVPVCVSSHRVKAGRALLAAHPEVDVLVCDDGLQHLALKQDLQIVVFDDRGTGNGWLLPAGMLREPWPRSIGATSMGELVLLQRREDAPPSPRYPVAGSHVYDAVRRLGQHAEGQAGLRVPLDELRGQEVTAVAGIARPTVFFDMLRACGLTLSQEVALSDHAPQSAYEAVMQDSTRTIVCTEKDAVKLFPMLAQVPYGERNQAWAIPLEMVPDADFFKALDERMDALRPRP